MNSLSRFLKENLLGIFITAVAASLVAAYIYSSLNKTEKTEKELSVNDKSEIGLILNGCDHVPPGISRFVIIPTTPTGIRNDAVTISFTGTLSNNIAVTRYAELSKGLEAGLLKVYRKKYSIAFADPETKNIIANFSGSGITSFDLEKRSIDQALVSFLKEGSDNHFDFTTGAQTTALSGKCNLINLIIVDAQK